MKITKSTLKQIIQEEYAGREYDEGHADSYNYGDTTPRKDNPEYLKGFEAGIRQKEEESGDDYYDIRKSDLGPDRLEEDEWPDKVKKGRFTSYCKREGFDGPGIGCAEKAMDSDDASVRGMASFYMNTVKPKGKDASDVAEENLNLKLTKESLSQMIGEVLKEYGYRGRPTKAHKKKTKMRWNAKVAQLVKDQGGHIPMDMWTSDLAHAYNKRKSPAEAAEMVMRIQDKISETSMASGAVQGHVSNTTKNHKRNSLVEKAPPGKEDMVKALKKKMCGGKDDCPQAFATAWKAHNKNK